MTSSNSIRIATVFNSVSIILYIASGILALIKTSDFLVNMHLYIGWSFVLYNVVFLALPASRKADLMHGCCFSAVTYIFMIISLLGFGLSMMLAYVINTVTCSEG